MAKKILLADDDPVVIKTFRTILERAGYEVITASTGEDCVQRLIFDSPDLILLDIMMPKMDGYSFLITLKELKAMNADLPDIPVIVITGRADESAKELVGKENIKDYIVKPLADVKEFVEKIRNLIGE
jgi:CheY-like chemotaxis protein